VISTGSKGGSVACGKSVSIFSIPPSSGVPGVVAGPSVLVRIGPGAMSAWLSSAVAATGGKVPDGVGKVKPRLARSLEPTGVDDVMLKDLVGNSSDAVAMAVAAAKAVAVPEGVAVAGTVAAVLVGAVFVKCPSLDLPINHCKAASSSP
jgi:hypothetical protein